MAWICFFGLFSVVIIKISADFSPKYRYLLVAACGVCLFLGFFRITTPVLEELNAILKAFDQFSELRLMLKALGIAFLVAVSASFCRDLGENGIAEKIELCGKSAVLALSLPVLTEILNFIGELCT